MDVLFIFRWGNIEFPLPFGRVMSPTESFIHGLDEKVNKYTSHIYQQSYSIHLKLSTKVTNLKQFDSYSVDI